MNLLFKRRSALLTIVFCSAFYSLVGQVKTSEEIIDAGIKLHDEGKYAEAISMYKLVNENDSNYYWAVYEISYSYLQKGDYDSTIYFADRGLEFPNDHMLTLLRNKGTAYDYLKQPEKAIEIYQETLNRYPYAYLTHYNMGVTYLGMNDYKNAVSCFEEALKCNPFHASSHMQLGKIMARQKQYTRALISLETFLALEPNSKRSNSILIYIENICTNHLDTAMGDFIEPFMENDLFSEIDHYIRSKVVLNDRYPSVIDFDANFVKQSQMLFEVLPFNSTSDDFWVQLYFSFFKAIKDGNHIVPFLYTLLRSTSQESVNKYASKNEKALNDFYSTGTGLSQYRSYRYVDMGQGLARYACDFYKGGDLQSIGNSNDNGNEEGPWKYFYANGEVKACGTFINGEKDGEWKYYYSNGILKSCEHFKDLKLNGEYADFHTTGKKATTYSYTNGVVEGEVVWHDIFGIPYEKNLYSNNSRNGAGTLYYPDSSVRAEFTYKDNQLEGSYVSYHPNGKISTKKTFKAGNEDGEILFYFSNGQQSAKGQYKDGKQDGKWIYYHSNGTVSSEVNFVNGTAVGEIKEYYHNGNIKEVNNYNEDGVLQGSYLYYDYDGQLYLEEVYDNGKIVKVSSIRPDGTRYAVSENSEGTFKFTTYDSGGRKSASGEFIGGKRVGVWTFYHKNGKVKYTNNYKDGKLVGDMKQYYRDGSLQLVQKYESGELNGPYVSYHENGKISSEGYFKNGNQDGLWKYYLKNGQMERTFYYIDNDLKGWDTYYSVDGKITNKTLHQDGLIIRYRDYDVNGQLINDDDFLSQSSNEVYSNSLSKNAAGTIIGGTYYGDYLWYYPSGKIMSKKRFINGKGEGNYFNYFNDGNVKTSGSFFDGDQHGHWLSYNENGKITIDNNFYEGEKDSVCVYYFDDGIISVTEEYNEGLLNGNVDLFGEKGDLGIRKIYSGDELIGYQYMINGSLCDTIKMDSPDQKIVAYFNNGKKSYEQQFKNYLPDGPQIRYFSTGTIMKSREYKKDLLNGKCQDFFLNGKLKYDFLCEDDLFQGDYTEYFENGVVKKVTTYLNDEPNGTVKYYDKTGKLVKTEELWSGNFVISSPK